VGRNLRFSLPAGKSYSCLIMDATNLVLNLVLVLFSLFEATGKAGRTNPVGTMFATMKNQKARPASQPRRAFVLCSPKPIPASIHEYETQMNSWVPNVHQIIVVADQ
jgi:hypothetical protein